MGFIISGGASIHLLHSVAAHKAIAHEGTVVLSDGKTSDNIVSTVAQAMAVSSAINLSQAPRS